MNQTSTEDSSKRLTKRQKIVIVLCVVFAVFLLLTFVIVPYAVCISLYNSVFDERFTSYSVLSYSVDEFEGLQAQRHQFTSYDGETLVGYRYFTQNQPCGVVVIAHGFGGGGHNSYMDVAYYFASNGFDVFAYDATGNDESGGDAVNGLPQGVKDLSCAIEYLAEIPQLSSLPIFLWGHSWGGYCVSNVLNFHPEVKAVVSVAGFNRSGDLLYVQGKEMVGGIMDFALPYVNSYEKSQFGKYAKTTSLDGFANSEAGVYIVHSADDTVVPIQYGYDIYYEKYCNNSRFVFKRYTDRGHNNVFYSQASIDYINQFNREFAAHFEGQEVTAQAREEYLRNNLDRNVWCNLLDVQLFDDIVNFYKSFL